VPAEIETWKRPKFLSKPSTIRLTGVRAFLYDRWMQRPTVQEFCELAQAIAASRSMDAVEHLLAQYEAGEIEWNELLSQVEALRKGLR
jgi:hypothetical protein